MIGWHTHTHKKSTNEPILGIQKCRDDCSEIFPVAQWAFPPWKLECIREELITAEPVKSVLIGQECVRPVHVHLWSHKLYPFWSVWLTFNRNVCNWINTMIQHHNICTQFDQYYIQWTEISSSMNVVSVKAVLSLYVIIIVQHSCCLWAILP